MTEPIIDSERMSLGRAWIIYLFLLLITSLTVLTGFVFLTIPVYLVCGIYLNRGVLRKLIGWHPVYNTLENVYSTKMKLMLFWVITYPILFLKLWISRVI